ncbi:diphthine methyl ester synthase [Plasmodiophora brassicae]
MLYIIGLGLADEEDISVKGLKAVRACSRVYLEAYTSILTVGVDRLEKFYGRPVVVADREMVESQSDAILENADVEDVAFLVVGDPFAATTHVDFLLRAAEERNVVVKTIHNASVMNAIGACGLQLYQFGQTVSIPFFRDNWRPDSFYDKIKVNKDAGFHTLCLLDIKVKEQSEENMLLGRLIYEPPRFMTVNEALSQIVEVEERRQEGVCPGGTRCIGVARLGADDQMIVAGTIDQLRDVDFGAPLHCLVIVGETHFMEDDALRFYSVDKLKQ